MKKKHFYFSHLFKGKSKLNPNDVADRKRLCIKWCDASE